MNQLSLNPIGRITFREGAARIALETEYLPALAGLEGFSHIQVLWWFNGCDNGASRSRRTEDSPYRGGPATLGTFATRSPERPNPIALTCAGVLEINGREGFVTLDFIDAEEGSPVLDIKPYTPSLDRVERPAVPEWCGCWPGCVEDSGGFDWGGVFRF